MNSRDIFVYGAQFHRPPNPPETQRKQDIKNFKKLGFNTVKSQARLWAFWQYREVSYLLRG